MLFVGIIMIGFFWSCEEDKTEIFWDDNVAATLVSLSPTGAMVGEKITIEGKYFSSTAENTVSFNGINATVTSANLSIIEAIMPEGATDGEIKVTKNGMVSNGLSYTVIQPIIPTITSIAPAKGKVGQTVVITGIDFSTNPSENIVSFNGVEATVSESTATTLTVTVPAGAETGNVTVTRDGESNGVLFTVSVSYTVVIDLSADEDDAEEGALNGAMALTSSDLELGEYDTWTQGGIEQGVQTIGVRFNAVEIPVGASVLSANIQFTCDATGADEAEMTIYGESIGNAPGFTEDAYNITSRAKTTEKAVWDIPEWVNVGDAGAAQRTPELAGVVQEILNRADWASGNSMVFILAPSGSTVDETSSSGGREAEADVGSDAAQLTIVYEL